MGEWEYICNGGPNGRTVCGTAKSVGAACGGLEKLMKALGATIGQVQRTGSLDGGKPVETEEEAGVEEVEKPEEDLEQAEARTMARRIMGAKS